MKNFRKAWPYFLGMGIIATTAATTFTAVFAQSNTRPISQAQITEILEGNQVYIQNRPAKVNDTARRNEQIRTGQARAQIQFDSEAIARLGKNSSLTVGQCGAQLQQGSVLVTGGASACTSTITAAVRGTTYTLEIDDDGEERIQVLEGEIDVTRTDDSNTERQTLRSGDLFQFSRKTRRAAIRALDQNEFGRILRGPLVTGYREDLPSYARLERSWRRLYPGITFPLKRAVLNPHRGHFNLGILQSRPIAQQVIARISLQSRRANGFLSERFVGDFLYPVNSQARFIRGLNPDDRIIVRLFDAQSRDRLIGYTEIELLEDNAFAAIVLPDRADATGTIRTVVGLDSDRNGAIDPDTDTVYDYFSQVQYGPNQRLTDGQVIFLDNPQDIDVNAFNPLSLPAPARNSVYPRSFRTGSFALVNRTTPIFTPDLEPTISALPGQRVPAIAVTPGRSTPTYEVTRQILQYKRR